MLPVVKRVRNEHSAAASSSSASEEARKPTRVENLASIIRDASTQGTLELTSSQPLFTQSESDQIVEALRANQRVKSIYFKRVQLSPTCADRIVDILLDPAKQYAKIRFPVFSNIIYHGQLPLMEREEDYPERAAAYTARETRNVLAYQEFCNRNSQVLAVKDPSTLQSRPFLFQFSYDFLERQLRPFVVSAAPVKTIIIEHKPR